MLDLQLIAAVLNDGRNDRSARHSESKYILWRVSANDDTARIRWDIFPFKVDCILKLSDITLETKLMTAQIHMYIKSGGGDKKLSHIKAAECDLLHVTFLCTKQQSSGTLVCKICRLNIWMNKLYSGLTMGFMVISMTLR